MQASHVFTFFFFFLKLQLCGFSGCNAYVLLILLAFSI